MYEGSGIWNGDPFARGTLTGPDCLERPDRVTTVGDELLAILVSAHGIDIFQSEGFDGKINEVKWHMSELRPSEPPRRVYLIEL